MAVDQVVTLSSDEISARMENARRTHAELSGRISALKGQAHAAAQQLAELQDEALREFGTSNVDELRELYKRWQSENAAALLKFEGELESVSSVVTQLEQSIKSPTPAG